MPLLSLWATQCTQVIGIYIIPIKPVMSPHAVHTVGKLLAQTRAHAYRLAEALTSLNHQLPVEERLEVRLFLASTDPSRKSSYRLNRAY